MHAAPQAPSVWPPAPASGTREPAPAARWNRVALRRAGPGGARPTGAQPMGCLSFVLDDPAPGPSVATPCWCGAARCDFQQGDAHTLYRSIHRATPPCQEVRLLLSGHDYTARRPPRWLTEKAFKPRLGGEATNAISVVYHGDDENCPPHRIASPCPAICVPANPSRIQRHGVPPGESSRSYAAARAAAGLARQPSGRGGGGGMCARRGFRWSRWSQIAGSLLIPLTELEARTAESQRINPSWCCPLRQSLALGPSSCSGQDVPRCHLRGGLRAGRQWATP